MARVLVFVMLLVAALPADLARADDARGKAIPILVYHRFGPAATELTTIRTDTLEWQLEWLRANNISVQPLHQLVDGLKASPDHDESRRVVLAADDGHASIYTQMFPLIRRYRVPVTLFVYPSAISNAKTALTWEQLADMKDSGLVDVQSHTFWHPNFHTEKSRLAPVAYEEFARRQLTLSKSVIEAHLMTKVDLLAWPFGLHDSKLEHWAADAGYVAAFGIERRRVNPGDDIYALPRFEVTDADRGQRFARLVLGHQDQGTPQ